MLAVGHACDIWQVQSSGDWHWDFYCHWQDQRCNGRFTGGTASSGCCSVPCGSSMVCASAVLFIALHPPVTLLKLARLVVALPLLIWDGIS